MSFHTKCMIMCSYIIYCHVISYKANGLYETPIPLHANLLGNLQKIFCCETYGNFISHDDNSSCLSGAHHSVLHDCYILPG